VLRPLFWTSAPVSRQFRVEMNRGADTAKEVVQVDELIRGMSVLIGQPETEQDCVEAEDLLELNDDGN